jgi:O-antigen ligase
VKKFVNKKGELLHFTVFHSLFLIFILICAASLLFSPDGVKRLHSLLQILMLSIVITDTIVNSKSIWPVKYGLIIGTTISSILLNLQIRGAGMGSEMARAGSTLGNPNLFSLALILGITFLFYELLQPIKRFGKYNNIFCVSLILYFAYQVIYYTGSRKGFVQLFVINILFLSYIFLRSNYKGKLWVILSFPVLQYIFAFFLFRSSHFGRMENLLMYAQGGYTSEGSLTARTAMLETAVELWKKKPILGWGIDQFRVVSGFEKYSHNNFAEILVNNGLLGFSVYYLIYVLIFFSAYQLYRMGQTNISFWIFLVTSLLLINDFGMVSYYSKFYWILFSTVFGVIKIQKKQFSGPLGQDNISGLFGQDNNPSSLRW